MQKPAILKAAQSTPIHKAPNFDEVVRSIRGQGIKAIRKRKFSLLGEDLIPDTVLGKSFDLNEPPVKKPLFWVPIGFDGYGWKVYLCVPPWMKNAPIASKWYLTWRDFFELGTTDELLEDPEYFVHSTLDELTAAKVNFTSNLNPDVRDDFAAYQTAVVECHDLLRRAMVEAFRINSSSESCESQRHDNDRNLPLSDEIARIMELSFQAGRLYERRAWYGRKIPMIARKAMPLVVAQKNKSGPRLSWTKIAAEFLCENPAIKPRELLWLLADILHAAGNNPPMHSDAEAYETGS
jgi:hypothetical protein